MRHACSTVLVLCLAACGPKTPGDTDATTGTSTATIDSDGATTGTGSSTSVSTTSTTSTTTADTTSITTSPTTTSTTTTGPDTTTDATTGGEPAIHDCAMVGPCEVPTCDFEACTCTLIPPDVAFLDCGHVHWHSPIEAWQDAHDCALAAASQKLDFTVAWDRSGIDSLLSNAIIGQTANGYQLQEVRHDSFAPDVHWVSCKGIAAIPGCTVEPGRMCLECLKPGADQPLCDAFP